MNKGFIKGVLVKISPELEEQKLRFKVAEDTKSIVRYQDEIKRYQEAILRATKRIKKNRRTLKVKFLDLENRG